MSEAARSSHSGPDGPASRFSCCSPRFSRGQFRWGCCGLYTRAVRRSMRTKAHTVPPGMHRANVRMSQGRPGRRATRSSRSSAVLERCPGSGSVRRVDVRPRHAAIVYAIAGCAYGVVMAAARLVSAGMEILPLRFLSLSWVFPGRSCSRSPSSQPRPGARRWRGHGVFHRLFAFGGIAMQTSPT